MTDTSGPYFQKRKHSISFRKAVQIATITLVSMVSNFAPADEGAVSLPQELLNAESLLPAPTASRVLTHVYRTGPPSHTGARQPEKLVYSNTQGASLLKFNIPNRRYADDLTTTAIAGCRLTRFEVRVNGGVTDGTGTFSCEVGLFSDCPSPAVGGILIPGTDATFTALSDDSAIFHDLVVDTSALNIPVPPRTWVRVSCSTAVAGWVANAPAQVGHTANEYYHPSAGCASSLGPNTYAGFHVQLFAEDAPGGTCATSHVVYSTSQTAVEPLSGGAGVRLADDFKHYLVPFNDTCTLAAYDVLVRGSSGPFTMNIDLRTPFSDVALSGTEFTHAGIGDGSNEFVRHVVPENIDIQLPATTWVSWQADKTNTGMLNGIQSLYGFSVPEYFRRFMPIPAFFAPQASVPNAAAAIVVHCRGTEPTGACCPVQSAAANLPADCLDNVTLDECLLAPFGGQDGNRWLENSTCAQNGFDPPCGTHACCTLSGCQDLTFDACHSVIDPTSLGLQCTTHTHCPGRTCQSDGFCSPRTGVWNPGEYCDPDVPPMTSFDCPYYVCHFGAGNCLVAEVEVPCQTNAQCPMGAKCQSAFQTCTSRGGCRDLDCCNSVCPQDSFCCNVMWDGPCVNQAMFNCQFTSVDDCNQNQIPDPVELANGTATDCNASGVLDLCEITDNVSLDCNGNSIPDECEIDQSSTAPGGPFFCISGCNSDCNANGVPDACDLNDCVLGDDACADCNENGILDSCDIANGLPIDGDSDLDGVRNCEDICPGVDDALYGSHCADAIPTTSQWGLVVFTLLLLTAAKTRFTAQV